MYERPGPITPADQAKAAADAERFAGLDHVAGKVVGPVPASDGRALQMIVPVEMGSGGWNDIAPVVEEVRAIARSGGGSVHVTGPAGYATDIAEVFKGIDATLLYITAGRRDRDPAAHLPQPDAVAAARSPAGRRPDAAQAVIYLLASDAGLTVNAQSASS